VSSEASGHWQPGEVVVLRNVETPTTVRMLHAINGNPVAPGSGKREPFLVDGEIVTVGARPYRVVVDSDDIVALYQPEGTPMPRWHVGKGRYLDGTQVSKGESLRLLFPGRSYDVTLFFEAAGEVPWFYDALFGGDGLQPGWREQRRQSSDAPETGDGAAPAGRRFRGWYVNTLLPFRRTPVGIDIVDNTLDIVVRPDRDWYWKDQDELQIAVAKGACSEAYARATRETGEDWLATSGPLADHGHSRRLAVPTGADSRLTSTLLNAE
jgi:hypothetical protein